MNEREIRLNENEAVFSCKAEDTVTIPREQYDKLVRDRERIEAVRRMNTRITYVSIEDILAVLDIYFQKEA